MGAIISIGAMVVIVQARWQPVAQGGTYQVKRSGASGGG